ncbi:hypothetical protein O0S10_00700 [Methanocorpusculum sp. MG]|uniref:Uncharacterized protein n=1 Tax=Methanocorpusculum petauri TaxID=3002863 RepID=A0ABT4IDD8_9EURY|nr:hypothetical protein [Methanocorpusculum petauri]MCZ0859742.1 hypothetical protein [Methanocorpusculum petauri]
MLPDQKRNTEVTEKKSIYDFLSGEMNVTKEIYKLADLFERKDIVRVRHKYSIGTDISLEQWVAGLFLGWNGRGSYLTPNELKRDMEIADIKNKVPNELQTTLYLEYLLNMIQLFERERHLLKSQSVSIQTPVYQALIDNLSLLLSQLNLTTVQKERGITILVPESPVVTEAVEIVEKPDVKLAILEYNHITNRNNLSEKWKILQILAHDFEPRRNELEKTSEGKNLASDLGFLFNKLNIRHNNTEGKKAVPAIQNMPEKDLLEWYDTTYRLYLTAVLLHDYANDKKQQAKITALKAVVNPR